MKKIVSSLLIISFCTFATAKDFPKIRFGAFSGVTLTKNNAYPANSFLAGGNFGFMGSYGLADRLDLGLKFQSSFYQNTVLGIAYSNITNTQFLVRSNFWLSPAFYVGLQAGPVFNSELVLGALTTGNSFAVGLGGQIGLDAPLTENVSIVLEADGVNAFGSPSSVILDFTLGLRVSF